MFEKIESFYNVIPDEYGNLYIERDGKKNLVPKCTNYFYFIFDNPRGSLEYVEKLCEEGKAFKISCDQLYKHYFNWSDEELCLRFYGYDLRTKQYFEQVKKDIYFIREDHGYDEEKLSDITEIECWFNTSKIEVGKTEQGEWCAQFSMRTSIDDYDITRYYFRNKPTKEDIMIIDLISSIEFNFFTGRLSCEFICYRCGSLKHWLDIEGSIFVKYKYLSNSCDC